MKRIRSSQILKGLAAVACLLIPAPLFGATIQFDGLLTGYSSFVVPQFNNSLGTLNSVDVFATLDGETSFIDDVSDPNAQARADITRAFGTVAVSSLAIASPPSSAPFQYLAHMSFQDHFTDAADLAVFASQSVPYNIAPGTFRVSGGGFVHSVVNGGFSDAFAIYDYTPAASPVPEPASITMLLCGGIGMVVCRVRRRLPRADTPYPV